MCRDHARQILPQLKTPSWPKLIGDGYVCASDVCGEHSHCIDVPEHTAPRRACGCHNCGQRRYARARAKHEPDGQTQRAVNRAKRRATRKLTRLERAIQGQFTPVRHSKEVSDATG